ncbi:hypothetical protein DDE18_17865 [Nocardioides gansuensis]|uniref:Endonuclease/exonuclease/phosphatase domain-containing protein n=1 Tax=Nocardioides gansuensis TaxID=2138300 RepID=A0A2T8F6M1_9ACTN|nr:endonuclease/exonuclease/phosphatase family protein [Nocardioides gansuensis]PVG81355.1 hypothetical protein DDE18_17865 [Nocardioides gansuensis]
MGRREQLVRLALLVLVVGVIATLMVLDRGRNDDRPETQPSDTPSVSPPTESTPTDVTVPEPVPEKAGATDKIPTPPPGLEDIVCRKLQESVRIRVMSFNTHRSFGSNGLARVAAEIRALEPDIVLLQEIDRFYGRTGRVDQAAWFANTLGMEHTFGANVVQGPGQYGTAILSRFPIVDSTSIRLVNGRGGEQRGLLGATLEIGGRFVNVYNTHLQNKLVGLREAQARQIAGILAQDDELKILGGDMNATINTPTLGAFRSQLVDSWSAAGVGPSGTGPGGSKIDFLLASPELEPVTSRVYGSAVSDHNRLVTDYVVPASTECPKARSGKKG